METGRGDAAAATRIFRGCRRDVEIRSIPARPTNGVADGFGALFQDREEARFDARYFEFARQTTIRAVVAHRLDAARAGRSVAEIIRGRVRRHFAVRPVAFGSTALLQDRVDDAVAVVAIVLVWREVAKVHASYLRRVDAFREAPRGDARAVGGVPAASTRS